MIGKAQLCAPSERDIENVEFVNCIENRSSIVFVSLLELFQYQSDLRQANIAQKRRQQRGRRQKRRQPKRRQKKQASEISVSMDISQTAQISLGMYLINVSNGRYLANRRNPSKGRQ
jgi:hypothetical protein